MHILLFLHDIYMKGKFMVAVAADTSESCSTYNTLCSISHEKKTYLNYNTEGQLFKIFEYHRENKKKKICMYCHFS